METDGGGLLSSALQAEPIKPITFTTFSFIAWSSVSEAVWSRIFFLSLLPLFFFFLNK